MRIEYGTTLTELLVATTIMLIVSLQVSSYGAQLALAAMKFQHRINVEDEIRSMQHTLIENIKRTGYMAYDPKTPAQLLTEGVLPETSLTIDHFTSEAPSSCVLFSFDKNENGRIDNVSSEQLGYRLRSAAIEYRVNSKTCDETGWHDLTDKRSVLVTKLHFTIPHSASWGTLLKVELHAQDVVYPDIKESKTFIISVANVHR